MRTTILQLREHLADALSSQKVRLFSCIACNPTLTLLCLSKDTIGYNMAALRQINRQQKTSKINEFYETEGFENADRLQAPRRKHQEAQAAVVKA